MVLSLANSLIGAEFPEDAVMETSLYGTPELSINNPGVHSFTHAFIQLISPSIRTHHHRVTAYNFITHMAPVLFRVGN